MRLRHTLMLASLSAVLFSASAAEANLNPLLQTYSAQGRNGQFVTRQMVVTCPIVDFTGVVVAGNRASGRLEFKGDPVTRRTCEAAGGLVSVDSTTRQRITVPVVASVARVSASGDLVLDSDYETTFDVPSAGCRVTVRGPQTIRSAWTFTVATQTFAFNARNISANGSGGLCGGAQTVSFTASIVVTSGGLLGVV